MNDIVNLLLSADTPQAEVVQILRHVAHVLVMEMAMTRNAETSLRTEHDEALKMAHFIEMELHRIKELIDRRAGQNAFRYGMENMVGIDLSKFDFDNSQPVFKTGRNGKVVLVRERKPRGVTHVSGREAPLLRISSEALTLPVIPVALVSLDPKDLSRSLSDSSVSRSDIGKKLNAYRDDLLRHFGMMIHRANTMDVLDCLFFKDDISADIDRGKLQLAALYCIYNSRAVRMMICAARHEQRRIEWAPLHPSNVWTFMNGLNQLSEAYHIGKIREDVYLMSMKHLHAFNFVPIYTNEELDLLLTPVPKKKKKTETASKKRRRCDAGAEAIA